MHPGDGPGRGLGAGGGLFRQWTVGFWVPGRFSREEAEISGETSLCDNRYHIPWGHTVRATVRPSETGDLGQGSSCSV